jgi:Ribbon-helix-helix protein, copG family
MARVKRRSGRAARVEQLSVFEGLEPVESVPTLAPDTMRQIVSLRMPDALVARVEAAARARGVSPSSLMRAFIAAGLDRSYAAVTESELASELSAIRQAVEEVASRLQAKAPAAPAADAGEGRA